MQLKTFCNTLISAAVTLTAFSSGMLTQATSYREAPLIAQDPAADISDTYAFRSWEDPSKVVFIMKRKAHDTALYRLSRLDRGRFRRPRP
jgi:uncharacterized protein DUF4331